jgi:hypothetical protein
MPCPRRARESSSLRSGDGQRWPCACSWAGCEVGEVAGDGEMYDCGNGDRVTGFWRSKSKQVFPSRTSVMGHSPSKITIQDLIQILSLHIGHHDTVEIRHLG